MNPFDLPGPLFLLFYIIFAGFVIGGLIFWRRRAELSGAPPRVDLSDPYLIAYLRGGKPEVLRVATIALIDRGLLVQSGTQIQRALNASPGSVHRPIEQALLKKYARAGEASWMFEDDGLAQACESYGATLRQARLLPDEWTNQRRLMRLVVASFLLSGVGLTKVLIALDAGRTNVGFLIVLIVIAIAATVMLSFPRLTESGKAMIQDVKSLYGGMRNRAALADSGGAAGIEPMMLAAVFGVGALAGSAFSYADSLFPEARKRLASNSCSSYHPTSCGGSSSSSSSSSDSGSSNSSCGSSGGSSCGSGCGGCGGS